ncbi:nuclease-related domain-containing protein [Microtetraspora malaysiensis]|uniref:nuclease-related domain-containing protein n=1 Tax=Microtetraspora malaysiensis TaxID=161358 RepID=UPI000836E151|nr:nuclease-related domain-containing protein [Microtetraspora malaysiensis]
MTAHTPGTGSAGASAQAHYRAQLARTRSRRWTARAAIAAAAGGAGTWVLGWRAGLAAAAVAAAADAVHRWRSHSSVTAWRKGAAGERATARLLRRLERAGYTVLHDRALPASRANVDHLVIGPAGVFVVDSKKWDRRTRISGVRGRIWIGKRPAGPVVTPVLFEARAVGTTLTRATGRRVDVIPVVAVHGAQMPQWGALAVDGVTLLRARRVPGWILRHGRQLDVDTVGLLAAAAASALPPAAGGPDK